MKFQKWCIEKWPDSFPSSCCVVIVPDLHHYQVPLFSQGNHLCLWAILLAVLSLLQRSARVDIDYPDWLVFYGCLFHFFHLTIWLQQGRMDEEVQGLLLQILKMSKQGQWGPTNLSPHFLTLHRPETSTLQHLGSAALKLNSADLGSDKE